MGWKWGCEYDGGVETRRTLVSAEATVAGEVMHALGRTLTRVAASPC